MTARGRERGSATIWVLSCIVLVLAVLTMTFVRASAVLARHRAESAADLAALAAAGRIGTAGSPCDAAADLAARNGARLHSCELRVAPGGRSGTVLVRVSATSALPVVGAREVSASARAGRLPTTTGVACFPGTQSVCDTRAGQERGGCCVELSVSKPGAGQVPVVAVSGEVDVYSAPTLRDGLTELIEAGTSVVVDLSDVGFLDSTGLGALVAARTTASERGTFLPLVCTHQRILKLFTITGLDGVFRIHASVAEALDELDAAAER